MPWNLSFALLAPSVTEYAVTIDDDQFISGGYNLYEQLGQPDGLVDVVINIVSGGRLGSLIIPVDFAPGSTFTINITGSGQILGSGGQGGFGGFGFPVGPGGNGLAGGSAINSAYDFSLDADNGYVLGGGGGGGGGGVGSDAGGLEPFDGGGGGGGQGWNNAPGGNSGAPLAIGESGSITGPGDGGTTIPGGNGGAGGTWGQNGASGSSGGGAIFGSGGSGGGGGAPIRGTPNPITVTLIGTKNAATLVSEGRFLGTLSNVTVVDPP